MEHKAQGIGIYFDGCADNKDCECCGDRWWKSSSFTAEEAVEDINAIACLYTIREDGTYLGMPYTLHVYFADGRHITKYGKIRPIKNMSELNSFL